MKKLQLATVAALLIVLLPGFILRGGGSPSVPGGTVSAQSFFNANAVTVSGPIPVMSGVWFPPGAVPAGSYATPSIGGTTLTQWELVSSASTWPDGSFRGGSFSGFLPSALTASTRQGITWKVVAGTAPAITPANPNVISLNTNFHVDLTNATSAYWAPTNSFTGDSNNGGVGILLGPVVTPGSGVASAVNVRFPTSQGYGCSGTAGNTNCNGDTGTIAGCTSAPTFSLTSSGGTPNIVTAATVISGGSGCPTVGSGTFTFNVNNILAGAGSSVPLCTDRTANGQVCQYSGSNVKNGFKVWGYFLDSAHPTWAQNTAYASGEIINANGNSYKAAGNCTSAVSGIGPVGLSTWSTYPNINPIADGSCSWTPQIEYETATALIEEWKTSGGGVYGFNISVLIDNDVYVAGTTLQAETFNIDLYDGAVDIRGSANDPSYTAVTQYGDGGGTCLCDDQSLPFWDIGHSTAQSTTLNQVIVSPSTADKTYYHANHALAPIRAITTTTNLILTRNNLSHLQVLAFDFTKSVPFCMCDVDSVSGIGSGGSHAWDGPITDAYGAWWEVEDTVSDGGWSWLGNIRNGAVNTDVLFGGPREPLTMHAVNWIPTAAWTPPANYTDPVRPNAEFFCAGGSFDMSCGPNSGYTTDTQHFPSNSTGIAYILEGRRYMLELMLREAEAEDMQNGTQYNRTAVFGGRTYYTEANSNSVRINSWYQQMIGWPAVFDAQESDGIYYGKQANDGFAMEHNFYSFVGNGTSGWGSTPFSKCSDWTASGYEMFPHSLSGATCGSVVASGDPVGSSWFMSGYQTFMLENNAMWLNGGNADLNALTNLYIGTAMIGIAQNCPFVATPYTIPWLTNVYNQTAVVGWDATTLTAVDNMPSMFPLYSNLLAWTSGNSTFTAAVFTQANESWNSTPAAALSGTTLTLNDSSGILGSQVYDFTTPANVPVDTYVTAGAPGTSLTVNQAVSVPAPVTTTVTVAPTSGGTTLQVASVAGIVAANTPFSYGSVVKDITNPSAFPAAQPATPMENPTVNTVTGGTTLNFLYSQGAITFATCPGIHCPAVGDTLQFSDMLTFSGRMDYPNTSLDRPSTTGTPIANGSEICLTNMSMAGEFAPAVNVGTYPPTTSAGGTLVEGQCFTWTQVGASGTAGTLTTLASATPPNTVVVPSSTGQGAFGFRANASCPAASLGTLYDLTSDYHNDGYRLAEDYGLLSFAQALGINPTGAASGIANVGTHQTPLNTVYGPSASGSNEQKWLIDNSF